MPSPQRSAQTSKEIKALYQRQNIHLLKGKAEGNDLNQSWLPQPIGVLPFLDQIKSNAPQVVRHLFINPYLGSANA